MILRFCSGSETPCNLLMKRFEPINTLFKDEVRELGIELGIPEHLVWRQPFPGPGLGIRVLGEITEDKLEVLPNVTFKTFLTNDLS